MPAKTPLSRAHAVQPDRILTLILFSGHLGDSNILPERLLLLLLLLLMQQLLRLLLFAATARPRQAKAAQAGQPARLASLAV